MTYYEHLPIYKRTTDVAVFFEKIVKNFSRYNKYTLGSEVRLMSRRVKRNKLISAPITFKYTGGDFL